jgi:hypothetical protein
MSGNNPFDANDVLVDQTMVCEASRFIDRKDLRDSYLVGLAGEPGPSNTERLLHFSMLLDALALHEHLFVLDAELPSDAKDLEFRNLLLSKGIIRELRTAPYAEKVVNDFQTFLNSLVQIDNIDSLDDLIQFNQGKTDNEYSGISEVAATISQAVKVLLLGQGPASYDASYSSGTIGHALASRRTGVHTLRLLSERSDREQQTRFERADLISRPFYVLGKEMLSDLGAFDSGHVGRGISHLRTFIYRALSEHARIVFYPSCRRAAQIDLLGDHLRASISEELYRVVARAFESDVREVYADEAAVPILMPPTLTIFLETFKTSPDLSRAIDSFRNEFAALRQGLRKLENENLEATTLGERLEIKHRIVQILESLKSHYKMRDDATLETVLGFGEVALKPLTSPLDPSKYSSELIKKPLNWIKTWWRNRPLKAAFQLKKRLQSIDEYEKLSSEVLGIEFDRKEKERFNSDYNSYLSLYQRKATPAPEQSPK